MHFYVSVAFKNFEDIAEAPVCFVVPSSQIESVIETDRQGNRKVRLRTLHARCAAFRDRWDLLKIYSNRGVPDPFLPA